MRPLSETVILRGGGLRRHKLTQHMFVVGDYLSEQASVGLSQKVVKRWHVSRAEAASFASTQKRVHPPTVGGGNEAVPGAGRVEQPVTNRQTDDRGTTHYDNSRTLQCNCIIASYANFS